MAINFQLDFLNTVVLIRDYEGKIVKISRDVPDSFFYMKPLNGNFYYDSSLDLVWNKNTSLIVCDDCQYIQEEYTNATKLWKENEKLLYSVKCDPLTKIANVNAVNEKKKEIINYSRECILVMCDINDFKYINDIYGHLIGDQALIEISKLFENNIRENDMVARIGGDEFLFIFMNKKLEEANIIMSNIKKSVDDLGKKLNIPLSISYGISSYKTGDNWNQKRAEADSILYENKEKVKKQLNK